MSFDARDVRRGKDVFDADGVYLGTVVWVFSKHATLLPLSRGSDVGAGPERACESKDVRAAQRRGRRGEGSTEAFSGESIGPMPTAELGNSGPRRQSQASAYGTSSASDDVNEARPPSHLLVIRLLTSLNWSTLRPHFWRIPVSLVQAVSHERIVLSATEKELAAREARRVPGLSDCHQG